MALLSFFNILTSFGILLAFLPSQLEAYYTTNTGCHHNGTWYADKSLVPTTEKCLNCQCNKKTLVCRLKVCPEMPMPPPRGCVVVQKKNTCCPYLSCARLDAFYKIPATRRIIAYLDHYERESIDRVVNENMLQRRSDDTDVDLYVCVKNGTVYKSGSAMSSSNLCSYCYCIGGTEKCVKPKCMLPLEGCRPIFVDSTCCPVRYDCSTKQTGKSSQEVRYRKTSNKHYLRMSQRLQRNHGCTVGQQFYTEGQKMKSDKDKPCDICFCIRGQRKCAPKKCAPALRNCIPVVPKGQCCPSSYDCGSQRDYRRSQNSRQFNLFSLLFGKDEEHEENPATDTPTQYPHDREPVNSTPAKYKSSITEKSFYDTIRDGLEFIDNNNNQMLKDNMELVDITDQHTPLKLVRPSPTPIPLGMHNPPSATAVNFIDLFLGPSETNQQNVENSSEEHETMVEQTNATNAGTHWVDLLLGPDEEDLTNSASTITEKIHKTDLTKPIHRVKFESTTSTNHMTHDSLVDDEENASEFNTEQQEQLVASTTDTSITTDPIIYEDATQTFPTAITEAAEQIKSTQPIGKNTVTASKKPITTTSVPSQQSATTTAITMNKTSIQTTIPPQVAKPLPTKPKPEKNTNFLSQLLDGLSDILGRENKTRINAQQTAISKLNSNKTSSATSKPMPDFKPLPQDKTYTRINSKIANLTVRPPLVVTKDFTKPTFKPVPLTEPTNPSIILAQTQQELTSPNATMATITTTKSTATTFASIRPTTANVTATTLTTLSTLSTLKPVVFKTNPSILEAEPMDQNADPTLPPSLPNLKIIPFLPTDAVKADQGSAYEFYRHPSPPISRIDYELYDDANLYPSITEKYPLYPDLEDGSKAEYIYKFNVEGPDSLVSSNAGKFDGTLGSPAFVKYDFAGTGTPLSTKGFSPPTKTEGGFVPKEPLILDDDDHDNVSVKLGDSYHVTQHIIDITTSADILNTTKVIEITTPDPFKDVIRTEPPPDLTSLIEDKLKNLISQSTTTSASAIANIINDKATNKTDIKMKSKPTDTKPVTLKSSTQMKVTATHNENNNDNNRTEVEIDMKNTLPHRIMQVFGDDLNDTAPVDVNDVTTKPSLKSLPTAQKLVHDNTSTTSKGSTKSNTNNKLKQTETTIKPMASATTISAIKITTLTTTKRPTTIKVNRNKTIATTAIKQTPAQQQQQQKPTTINKNSTWIGSEVKISASPATSLSPSTSLSSSSSAASVAAWKSQPNATRRVTSSKPTKHQKPTTNTTVPIAALKNTAKTNAINTDRTSVATRRTQKPTTNANMQAVAKPNKVTIATTKKTTTTTTTTSTTKPITAMRTTTSLPLTSPSLLQRVPPSANPFFMSPFDKLPFMDASFEVKRNSAMPSTTTTSTTDTTTSTQQHFAVAAKISTDALPDDANDEQDSDALNSSRHNLMGLVHYKHTLNQLEGLEPSIQQRPQHSFHPHLSGISTRVSSPSSTTTQQQQPSPSLTNLIDPIGILKLAGCNIYGRMYRVGRIILELSSPCLECKCTEIGVKCGPLDC